jgi:hypothetical protein
MQVCTVKLSPATLTEHGFTCTLMDPAEVKHTVNASTLRDLESQVRTLAAGFCIDGQHEACTVYVGLKDRTGRKPAGFDKFAKSVELIRAPAA